MGELAPDVLDHGQVTIGATPTLILGYDDERNRKGIIVTNLGTTDVWLGNWDVTTGGTDDGGDLLVGIKGATKSIPTSAALYGICATTQRVSWMATF